MVRRGCSSMSGYGGCEAAGGGASLRVMLMESWRSAAAASLRRHCLSASSMARLARSWSSSACLSAIFSCIARSRSVSRSCPRRGSHV